MSADAALDGVDVVILAVPDTLIGKLARRDRAAAASRHDGDDAGRRRALRRPPAASGPTWSISSPTPATPPSSAPRCTRPARPTTSAACSAPQSIVSALMQGPDSAFDAGRGHRQDDLPAHPALLPRDGGADGVAGARPVGNRVRHAAGRDARGDGRGGLARRARRLRARLPARPHDDPVGGDLQADPRQVLRRLQQGHHLRQAAPDARRLEEGVRARRDRREHPPHHLRRLRARGGASACQSRNANRRVPMTARTHPAPQAVPGSGGPPHGPHPRAARSRSR